MGADELHKKQIQKLMSEEQKRGRKADKMYGALPVIPSKKEIISKQFDERTSMKKIMNKNQQGSGNHMYSITLQPSIKPFIKRSLEPERRKIIQRKRRRKHMETVSNAKTIHSLMKRMAAWGG